MVDNPHVLAIMATVGRITCVRRALDCFLQQDYKGEHTLLIFNNSPQSKILHLPDGIPVNKHVKLINQPINSKNGNSYTSLGEIYNDIINFIPDYIDIVVHADDDDIYLPDHISKGVEGYQKCGKLAYKPKKSWFLTPESTSLMENTLEPSIFVNVDVIRSLGYYPDRNVSQHLKWVEYLTSNNQICSDPEGKPTLFYTWGIDIGVWKTSGAGETPGNFKTSRNASNDHGDNIIYPMKKEHYEHLMETPK